MNRDTCVLRLVAVTATTVLAAGCAGDGGAQKVAMNDTLTPADGDWIRCVDEPRTGSRIPQRNCLTESQWKRLEEASRDAGRALQGPMYGSTDVAAPGTPPL